MTGVEIAQVIRVRFSRILDMYNMGLESPGGLNDNVKSIFQKAAKYVEESIIKDCGLKDLDIDMEKQTIQCSTPRKGFTYKFKIVGSELKIFYPTINKKYYEED